MSVIKAEMIGLCYVIIHKNDLSLVPLYNVTYRLIKKNKKKKNMFLFPCCRNTISFSFFIIDADIQTLFTESFRHLFRCCLIFTGMTRHTV